MGHVVSRRAKITRMIDCSGFPFVFQIFLLLSSSTILAHFCTLRMAESQTTPTLLTWPSGPESVQVSGDWDQWAEKVALDEQADGSFSKKVGTRFFFLFFFIKPEIQCSGYHILIKLPSFFEQVPLPSNTKVHYKYIVDGNWTTSSSSPVVDDAGNQNNVVDVGPAPTAAEAVSAKAGEIGADVAAGVAGLAAAATNAAHQFTDHVNGTTRTNETVQAAEAPEKTLSTEEKKSDPASGIRDAADGDVRSESIYLTTV